MWPECVCGLNEAEVLWSRTRNLFLGEAGVCELGLVARGLAGQRGLEEAGGEKLT